MHLCGCMFVFVRIRFGGIHRRIWQMPHVITIAEFAEQYADWTAAGLAVQILALEEMGAVGE